MYQINHSSVLSSKAALNMQFNELNNVKFGDGDSVPINQDPSKEFNIDPSTGRPMQQITALLRAQKASEQMAILDGLEEFKSNYLPDDMSNEDAIRFMMPRYCQLPSQVAEFAANFKAEADIKKLNEMKADEEKKSKELEAVNGDSSPAAPSDGSVASSN